MADGLSRMPATDDHWEDDDAVEVAVIVPDQTSAVSETELRQASASDAVLAQVREALQAGRWSGQMKSDPGMRPFFQVRSELSCHDKLVFRGDRCVVPVDLRERLMQLAHETHPGVVRTNRDSESTTGGQVWMARLIPSSGTVHCAASMASLLNHAGRQSSG